AAYLKRGVTTVQRWERDEGMPIHRHGHHALGSVYAFKTELNVWRGARVIGPDERAVEPNEENEREELEADAHVEQNSTGSSMHSPHIEGRVFRWLASLGTVLRRSGSEATQSGPESVSATRLAATTNWITRLLVAGFLFGLVVLMVVGIKLSPRATGSPRVMRLLITPSSAAAAPLGSHLAIAPDGTRLAYVGDLGSKLFVRALDQLEARPIATGVPRYPFFSPDGKWVGFFEGRSALKKVSVDGGPVTTICRLSGFAPRGGAWGLDGSIIFSMEAASGLWRVPAAGGEPTQLAKPDLDHGEGPYRLPEFLPDGRTVLFTIGPPGIPKIAALDLKTGAQKILIYGGTRPRYFNGFLLYATREGSIQAVGLDVDKVELAGRPVTALQGVHMPEGIYAQYTVAQDGTLIYFPRATESTQRTLVWVDRKGHEQPIGVPLRAYRVLRLSPDGTQVALEIDDESLDIWIWTFAKRTLTRLTFDSGRDWYPVWTPGGERIVFASTRMGGPNLFMQAADGTGTVERLTQSADGQFPAQVSAASRGIIFRETKNKESIMVLDLEGERRTRPLIEIKGANQGGPHLSPDHRWLAYQSDESGNDEIYVRPYPNVEDGLWQVSTGGGTRPRWAPNGKELYYVSLNGALMAVNTQNGPVPVAGKPVELFRGRYHSGSISDYGGYYDVASDGQRFLMIKPAEPAAAPASIIVVTNWIEELKTLVAKH
ncbi:MAG: hypothetical protein AB7O65_00190, partial [Candidatus Korobacteraceae bacterium]